MKIKILALVLFLGIGFRVEASQVAAFFSAGDVLSNCESESVARINECSAYLAGVLDTTSVWVSWGRMQNVICTQTGINQTQIRKIFIKYANQHPEVLHLDAAGMVLNAFRQAFPCE